MAIPEHRWGPLAEPLFRRLFVGRLVSFLGSSVAVVALAFATLDVSGSPADLGIVLAAREVPQVISCSSAGSLPTGCRATG